MARAVRLRLEQGERRVVVVRRHWWLLVRPMIGLLVLLAAIPLYAVLDEFVPGADLARYSTIFLTADLGLSALIFVKWLVLDLARWWADAYVITNRRLVAQEGLITIERREVVLRAVPESNFTMSGAEARLLDYGDLTVRIPGRGKGIVLRDVPHPRRLHTLLAAQARAAREEHTQTHAGESEINAALTRIFSTGGSVHDSPTQAVPRITPEAARVQHRLTLLANEIVIHATRRHPFRLLKGALLPALLTAGGVAVQHVTPVVPLSALLVLVAIMALWLVWTLIDWRDDLYVLTTERIMELHRRPFISEMQTVVQLRSVQDVVLRISSIFGRLFSLGTITLEAGTEPLRLPAVPHPEQFQRMIFEQIDEAVQRDKLHEQEQLAGTLSEWFKEYHRMREEASGTGQNP